MQEFNGRTGDSTGLSLQLVRLLDLHKRRYQIHALRLGRTDREISVFSVWASLAHGLQTQRDMNNSR